MASVSQSKARWCRGVFNRHRILGSFNKGMGLGNRMFIYVHCLFFCRVVCLVSSCSTIIEKEKEKRKRGIRTFFFTNFVCMEYVP
jgi:hypothetical protein